MAMLPRHVHMASDYSPVVDDNSCHVFGVIDPAKNEFLRPATQFFVQFHAVIKRATSDEVITKDDAVDLDGSDPSRMVEALFQKLRQLLVPTAMHRSMVAKIMNKASEVAARIPGPYAGGHGKRVLMWVTIFLPAVIDDDVGEHANGGVGGIIGDVYEPRFVPASTMSIEKLEKTRVRVPSTMCSVCMEEMRVGFKATKMHCSHLYHEACIVEWLQRSGICPLCKFRMPE